MRHEQVPGTAVTGQGSRGASGGRPQSQTWERRRGRSPAAGDRPRAPPVSRTKLCADHHPLPLSAGAPERGRGCWRLGVREPLLYRIAASVCGSKKCKFSGIADTSMRSPRCTLASGAMRDVNSVPLFRR